MCSRSFSSANLFCAWSLCLLSLCSSVCILNIASEQKERYSSSSCLLRDPWLLWYQDCLVSRAWRSFSYFTCMYCAMLIRRFLKSERQELYTCRQQTNDLSSNTYRNNSRNILIKNKIICAFRIIGQTSWY